MKNPIIAGWYADPEARVYNGKVYMYVTRSLPYEEQKNLDVVISADLEHFEKVESILDMSTYEGATFAIWAPSVIEKNGKYYIVFAANNIRSNSEIGGLYVGVSDSPCGPFKNVFKDGRALIDKFHNGAQPIDAHFFKDGETVWLYYGGWRHLNLVRLNETLTDLLPISEEINEIFYEITPKDYVEAPCVIKIDGKYHLMYSVGSWQNSSYCVKVAVSEKPWGEFSYYADVMKANAIADGPGHNGIFNFNNEFYTAYHRRIIGDQNHHHRILCIDKLIIEDGKILPVNITN
jgi:beta-xylosidase